MLSVVIPLYNEARRLRAGLHGARELQRLCTEPVELVLVDDGSTDATLAVARAEAPPHTRILAEPHRGKGGALAAGVRAATGDRLLLTDVDWSVGPAEALRLLDVPGDVVLAVREGAGARRLGEPLRRHLVGRAFNALVKLAVVAGHEDTQCGCKLLRRGAAQDIFARLTVDGWAFDVELVVVAHVLGLDLRELPVTWRYQPDTRLSLGADGLQMARDVLHIRRRLDRGDYRMPRADQAAGSSTASTKDAL